LNRIKILRKLIGEIKTDAVILEDFLELFYLTNMRLSFGQLLITENDAVLFTDNRYLEEAKKKTNVKTMLFSNENIERFFIGKKIKKISFNGEKMSYQRVLELKKTWKNISFIPISDPLKKIRMIKNENEIKTLKEAAKITFRGYKHVLKNLQPGMTEKEASLLFEIYCLRNGAEKMSFEPIICFGKNSSLPHHRSDATKLKKNDLVLIDVGVVFNGYCSDMTRTIFFNYKNEFLENFYRMVKESYEKAVFLCRSGTNLNDIDKAARDVFKKNGVDKYFLHRLGHGIGMEVHEYPRIGKDENVILQPNMLITIEPGLYKENVGGVRHENTLLITKDGCEEITALENA
jgi:Xaa-Pro aminopeptidase